MSVTETHTSCEVCADGRMGSWMQMNVNGSPVSAGEFPLFGRVCDRCRAVESSARAVPPLERRTAIAPSPGGELLLGLGRNLLDAIRELWSLRPRIRRRQ